MLLLLPWSYTLPEPILILFLLSTLLKDIYSQVIKYAELLIIQNILNVFGQGM